MNNDQPANAYFIQHANRSFLDMDTAILYVNCRANVMPGTFRLVQEFADGSKLEVVGSKEFQTVDIVEVLANPGLMRIDPRYLNGNPADVRSFDQVMRVIATERAYQDSKWGKDKKQSVAGYLTIMRKELSEAEDGWLMGDRAEGRDSALAEIVQVAAVAVRCLQHYGTEGISITQNDLPNPPL